GTSSGLLWAVNQGQADFSGGPRPAALQAFDASTLGQLVSLPLDPDAAETTKSFNTPTVADGYVFVGTEGTLVIFGPGDYSTPVPPPAAGGPPAGAAGSIAGAALARWLPGLPGGGTPARQAPARTDLAAGPAGRVTDPGRPAAGTVEVGGPGSDGDDGSL